MTNNDTNPQITVFMAVYNGGAFIKKSIDCVLNQTFKDFELLIINDGSTDNSIEIVNSYSDSRIRVLHNEKNSGERFTRHRGIYEAKGTYLAILDCDDLASANRLELQYNYLKANPEIAVCGGWGVMIDENDTVFGHKIMPCTDTRYINIEMLFRNQFINSSVMLKTEVAKEAGGYSSIDIPPDYAFFSRISENYKMGNIPEFIVEYREHQNGISKTKIVQLREGEIEILKNLYKRFDLKDALIKVPHAFIKHEYSEINASEIKAFFEHIIAKNNEKKFFPKEDFNAVIFNHWYHLIREKKCKKCIVTFYKNCKKNNFSLTTKQKRKLFKMYINIFK